MIVPGPAVLVDAALAPTVAAMIAEAVRRDPARESVALRRLLADLSDVSDFGRGVSDFGRTVDVADGEWLDTTEVAERRGVSERTARRWAQAVAESRSTRFRAARTEGGRWRIKL